MIWMAMSSKEVSNVYVHESNQVVDQETYLKECIDRRLLLFIEEHLSHGNYLFWPDLARAHYSTVVQERLKEKKNIPFVFRADNPPNVPRARPIETIRALLERKVYENIWDAKNLIKKFASHS
jgi:hypothetical protein